MVKEDGQEQIEFKDDVKLRKLQICITDILKEFDRICREENLTYFLFGGSLLGAVRHGGFIPWDNDADVAMPRRDFERFKKLASEKLGQSLALQTNENDPYFTLELMRLRNMNTVVEINQVAPVGSIFHGAFLDIFPLDDLLKESSLEYAIQAKLVKQILKTMADRADESIRENKSIKQKLGNLIAKLHSRKRWIEIKEKIAQRHNGKDAEYFANFASHYDYRKQVFEKKRLLPAKEVRFEGHLFFAPKDYDYVLRKFYGNNYMDIPKKENRHYEEHLIIKIQMED